MPGDISMSKPSPSAGVPLIPPWVQKDIDWLESQHPGIFDDDTGSPALMDYHGDRPSFVALVSQVGKRVLLYDVRINESCWSDDRVLTPHIWLNGGKWSEGLVGGETIVFAARVDGNRLLRPTLISMEVKE